jgi:hypothetical protein
MNNYWSNEDDKKVGYVAEHPLQNAHAGDSAPQSVKAAAERQADEPAAGAFSAGQGLNRPEPARTYRGQPDDSADIGQDRSTFIAKDSSERQRRELQFAPPPTFTDPSQPPQETRRPDSYLFQDGYQIHSERQRNPREDGGGKRGWLVFLIVVLLLLLIGCGTYIFRTQILEWIGTTFGEEIVWKIMPTPAPTEVAPDVPAYVQTEKTEIKTKLMQEINAVSDGVAMENYAVTDQSIVMQAENPNGTLDFYLFAADTGRLLGYYEGLTKFVPCSAQVFYIPEAPYLITAQGVPLVDLSSFTRSVGGDVLLQPMINGWAIVSDSNGTMFNYVSESGALISNLWFAKAFPFTADTTLAYVDTGNVSNPQSRYALYLLKTSGETVRLSYSPNMDGVVESICGLAMMQNGDLCTQDEALTPLTNTDSVTAYVNCGALVVRDPDTKLYGLFVGGVQQYPFSFDSIEPMQSDIVWTAYENGSVRRYAAGGLSYPLPQSYGFILRKGDTEQVISIAAVSEYPIVFD